LIRGFPAAFATTYTYSMRYRLRTLLIVLAIVPPIAGVVFWFYRRLDPTEFASLTIWIVIGVVMSIAAFSQWDTPA
jgi:hypothetical protein